MPRILALLAAIAASLTATAAGQHGMRTENRALLGVVTAPTKGGLSILHVLEKSPAAAARIEAGDLILSARKKPLRDPNDLDRILGAVRPGESIVLRIRRGKDASDVKVTLSDRTEYPGTFLAPRRTGETGFKAPDWYAYGWGNLGKNETAPTRANTAGKTVIIHCFQSW